MGGFEPTAENFQQLILPADAEEKRSKGTPYPFFLASPLEIHRLKDSEANEWRVEWKWDGIRGQLIHRGHGTFLWSRGEELINDSFPEAHLIRCCTTGWHCSRWGSDLLERKRSNTSGL